MSEPLIELKDIYKIYRMGDEEVRAGMAYTVSASLGVRNSGQPDFLLFAEGSYTTNTNSFVLSPLWWYHIKAK